MGDGQRAHHEEVGRHDDDVDREQPDGDLVGEEGVEQLLRLLEPLVDLAGADAEAPGQQHGVDDRDEEFHRAYRSPSAGRWRRNRVRAKDIASGAERPANVASRGSG